MVRKTLAVGIVFLFIVSSVGSVGLETKDADMLPVESVNGPMDSAWPMYMHDVKHSGRSPYNTTNNEGIIKWTFWTDFGISSSPAIDEDGIIYVSSKDDYLYALYPNGTEKWRLECRDYIESSPAISEDGTIYVGNLENIITAVAPNGTKKWTYNVGDAVSSAPAIGDDGTEERLSTQLVISLAYVDIEEDTLTIMGRNFGTGIPLVTLGDLSDLTVVSWAPEEIVLALPDAADMSGTYLLTVEAESLPDNFDCYSLSIGPVDPHTPVDHDQLVINYLSINGEENRMNISGYNFDNGDPPTVRLDGINLPLVSFDYYEIIVDPTGLTIDVSSDSLLQVQTGGESINRDSFSFGVAEASTPPEDPQDCNPCWKEGPPDTSMWHGGQYGEPVYYQLLDDYTVDLPSYFTDYWALPLGTRNKLDELYELATHINDIPINNERNFLELTTTGQLTIKKGYRWDGPSTQPLWHYPVQTRASLVHDALYDLMRLGELQDWYPQFSQLGYMNRLLADCMFYMICIEDGYFRPAAFFDFCVIRIGGWGRTDDDLPSWKEHAVADAGPSTQFFDCGMPVTLDGSNSRFATEWIWTWTIDGTSYQESGEVIHNVSLDQSDQITLTVDDGDDGDDPNISNAKDGSNDGPYKDYDYVIISVKADTEPPVFRPVDDIIQANDPGECSAVVDFTVTAIDNCCDPEVVCDPSSGSQFPIGTTTVFCTAIDTCGNEANTQFHVTVEDKEPPVITGITEPITMWPPNHKYKTFTIGDFVSSISDNCTVLTIDDLMITKVTSDESENASGCGDGNTMSDIILSPEGTSVDLRKERQGKGNGRVYTIFIVAIDEKGNAATESFQVTVPRSKKCNAIDDGPAYSVTP